ncbi:hypothetical protein NDU88_001473 [Pleurodeles waltl]|uniref:Uncharacterized protein n=1 Tax=Pleurodeles waltl TaxID=8319 RepID=A0AAV7UUU4_PLEWA|nr:hypothetical protein NDU88_001473 [Pleurodeles waltl]
MLPPGIVHCEHLEPHDTAADHGGTAEGEVMIEYGLPPDGPLETESIPPYKAWLLAQQVGTVASLEQGVRQCEVVVERSSDMAKCDYAICPGVM